MASSAAGLNQVLEKCGCPDSTTEHGQMGCTWLLHGPLNGVWLHWGQVDVDVDPSWMAIRLLWLLLIQFNLIFKLFPKPIKNLTEFVSSLYLFHNSRLGAEQRKIGNRSLCGFWERRGYVNDRRLSIVEREWGFAAGNGRVIVSGSQTVSPNIWSGQ